ncbi:MAG: LamG domain-containing protein, partial [archaeon]
MPDYGENATLFDYSGLGNNGSCSGSYCPNWSLNAGRYGGGYGFDGEDDYVDAGEINYNFSGQKNFSSFAWIKPNNLETNYIYGSEDYTAGWYIRLEGGTTNGEILVKVDDGTNDAYESSSTNQITKGWHFVGIQVEDGRLKGFIDGEEVINIGCSEVEDMMDKVRIGNAGTDDYFNGSIDEVMIFNRSLSENEIKQIYNSQVRKFPNMSSSNPSEDAEYSNKYNEQFNSSDTGNSATLNLTSTDINMTDFDLSVNQTSLIQGKNYDYDFSVFDLAGNENTTET